jgi:hypothetical protein
MNIEHWGSSLVSEDAFDHHREDIFCHHCFFTLTTGTWFKFKEGFQWRGKVYVQIPLENLQQLQ